MARGIGAALTGTLVLRLATSLTGTMLIYYLVDLPKHGGSEVQPVELGLLGAAFYLAELLLAPPLGALSDRLGHHRMLQWGPIFGLVAVVLTWATTNLLLLGGTRLLEGASTAASASGTPAIPEIASSETFVKRLIGMPGETIGVTSRSTPSGMYCTLWTVLVWLTSEVFTGRFWPTWILELLLLPVRIMGSEIVLLRLSDMMALIRP